MLNPVRKSLDILMTLGGLAMGAVLSLLFALLLLLSDFVVINHTVLALSWIMLAFVFAIAYFTAK